MLGRLVVGLLLLSVASRAPAAEADAPRQDPWKGKTRSEVVGLLGEPDKTKTDKQGVLSLTYRFNRIDPMAPSQPDAIFLQVPGVGVVARIDKSRRPPPDAMTIEPPQFDEQGRQTAGGVSETRSATTSYDIDSKEVSHSTSASAGPPGGSRVTLRFEIGSDGRVVDWTTTGEKGR
ncbi:MAG TPA: hypothetical protein VD788_11225 [Candidatus Polarisedimenticolaceae bacterium]|nr:hypothetical protein [Candidatus Polarisedimenticolaceae bacterium]